MGEKIKRKVKQIKKEKKVLKEISRRDLGNGWDEVEYEWIEKPKYVERP